MAGHDGSAEDELSVAESTTADAHDTADFDAESGTAEVAKTSRRRMSPVRMATAVGLAILVVAAGLVGYLGFRTHQSQVAKDRDHMFVEVARQGAVNLTTIDWQQADNDIQRILDSATGTFYDDFTQRSQPFVEVVKQAKSTSTGTVTEAGLETESGDQAQVLVAVSVKTTTVGAAEQQPRAWRMRIDVQKVGDQAKVSNVQFVP